MSNRRRAGLALGLLLLEELDNKVLILPNEVIGETLGCEVIAKVFSPKGVKTLQRREFGLGLKAVRASVAGVSGVVSRRFGRSGGRRMAMPSKQTSEESVMLVMAGSWGTAEWSFLCSPACVLFPFVNFLQELLRLLLVDKGQAGETVLKLEGVEKDAVLVVAPVLKDLLVPDYTTVSRLSIR